MVQLKTFPSYFYDLKNDCLKNKKGQIIKPMSNGRSCMTYRLYKNNIPYEVRKIEVINEVYGLYLLMDE